MSAYYSYTQLHEGVYRILADGKNCCELIVGSKKAALLDTGLGFGDLPGLVRQITSHPLIILNTHNHIDHAGGNALFDQPAYMGAEDIETFDHGCGEYLRRITVQRYPELIERLKKEGLDPEAYIHMPRPSLLPCGEGDVFDLGGFTLRVYDTPGHSVGGRSFYLEQLKYLYTGDAVYPRTLVFGYGSADRATHAASLEKILAVPFDKVYGNHRESPMTRENIELYLKAAREVRYEDGCPFPNPIQDGEDARTCCLPGWTPEDEQKEGYASVVFCSYNC